MNIAWKPCAFDVAMFEAWQELFKAEVDVTIELGNILDHVADAIVRPANSFGFMDGGIDMTYSHSFGWDIEARLKSAIGASFSGELLVGQTVIVETGHASIRWRVSAPTMRIPQRIDGMINVYLAFRAALMAIRQHNASRKEPITSVLWPGRRHRSRPSASRGRPDARGFQGHRARGTRLAG